MKVKAQLVSNVLSQQPAESDCFTPVKLIRTATGHKSMTVLLVEDDEADAYLITESLRKCPPVDKIVRSSNGGEALGQLAMGLYPDVAIVDLNMPKLDGFGFLKQLRSVYDQDLPVIVMTSSKASEDAYRSYRRGAWLAVSKPLRAEKYVSFFNTILSQLAIDPQSIRSKVPPWSHFLDAA